MKKILSIGSDRGVFREGSAVQKRILKQGQYLDELHIIVFTQIFKHWKLRKIQLGKNIWLYPTRSWTRALYIHDAVKLGKTIVRNSKFEILNSVITSQDPFEAGWAGMRLKILSKIPFQIQVHTDFLSPHFAHILLNRIRVRMAFRTLPYADRIRVVSKRIKDSLVESFKISGDKISVLPVFVDIEALQKDSVEGVSLHKKYSQFNFIVLMASRLTREKNIDLAIQAFAQVHKAFPQAGLVIVGQGPQKNTLVSLVGRLSLEKSVMFENWNDDISSYYKTANLFLSTSLYEGFGMTLIEAAAAGCPLVTSDVGVVGDVFTSEHVAICPVHSKECFAEHVISIISHNQKREIMKQNARSRVLEIFDLDSEGYAKKYIEEIVKTGN